MALPRYEYPETERFMWYHLAPGMVQVHGLGVAGWGLLRSGGAADASPLTSAPPITVSIRGLWCHVDDGSSSPACYRVLSL